MARSDADLTAILHRVAAAIVRPDDARRDAVIDRVTGNGVTVLLTETSGTLPEAQRWIVEDESVRVSFPSFSPATNLETLLAQIIAGIGAAGFDVDTILTDDYEVLVDSDGNVMVDG